MGVIICCIVSALASWFTSLPYRQQPNTPKLWNALLPPYVRWWAVAAVVVVRSGNNSIFGLNLAPPWMRVNRLDGIPCVLDATRSCSTLAE